MEGGFMKIEMFRVYGSFYVVLYIVSGFGGYCDRVFRFFLERGEC